MTIRQLYYTSCQQGKEGIRGFQVNAASPGLDAQHEDLGLRLSAYRPPPAAPVSPTPEQVERFPVSVGYRSYGDVAVLFHSRYLGTDFTGRQGNYFAHVLILDAPGRDLDGMLPVEAWESALWRWQPVQDTRLPTVDAIPPGPLANTERIRAHLLQNRLPEFGALLSAVQTGLSGDAGRIVVVAPDAADVAWALTAVTRSLPTTLAATVSFTTFTSSPSDADVLVVGTTPDVDVASNPYHAQLVVTLADAGAAGGKISRYASVLSECWTRGVGTVREVVALAARVSPPLTAAELDQFADLIAFAVPDLSSAAPGLSGAAPGSSSTAPGSSGTARAPLPAVEFALDRLPSVLSPALWQRLDDQIRQMGALDDVRRWSTVLAAASSKGTAPGPELESAYIRAALSQIASGSLEPAKIWLPPRTSPRREQTMIEWARGMLIASPPLATVVSVLNTLALLGVRLSDAELRSQIVEIVLHELLNAQHPDGLDQLKRLPDSNQLLPLVCDQLENRLTHDTLFDTAVEEKLSPAAVELIELFAPRHSRCALAATLVQARTSQTERVPALLKAVPARPNPQDVERFAPLLWPELPTAAEGVELCRSFDTAVLGATRIPHWLLQRLLDDAEGAGLTTAHEELAEQLATEPMAQSLGSGVNNVDCIRWGAHFNNHRPKPSEKTTQIAVEAVYFTTLAAPKISDWTLRVITKWLLSLTDPNYHAKTLIRIVEESTSRDFLAVYSAETATVLSSRRPAVIADVLPAIVFLADRNQAGLRLLSTTCRDALAGRRKRDLDAVGRSLAERKRRLPSPPLTKGNKPAKDWPAWWDDWRERNLPKSTFARITGRLTRIRFPGRRASGGER